MLTGYKTYILAALTVAYAVIGSYIGQIDGNAALQLIVTALGAAFVRHGVSTSA